MANYNIELSNILYHLQLSMASVRFCETSLLHIKPFVVNKPESAIFPFLGVAHFLLIELRREVQNDMWKYFQTILFLSKIWPTRTLQLAYTHVKKTCTANTPARALVLKTSVLYATPNIKNALTPARACDVILIWRLYLPGIEPGASNA